MMMSTRTPKAKGSQQDPRYLQLWLTFDWPTPGDRVPVECAGCALDRAPRPPVC